MPGILNLAAHHVEDDTPEEALELYTIYRENIFPTEGSTPPTLWKRVTGDEFLAISLFPDLDTLNECENRFVMTNAFERFVRQTDSTEDVDRMNIIHHQGATPNEVLIEGYCTTNTHIAAPGHVQDELAEARYILDSLWQIDGFLGAYVGGSLIVPGRLHSLAFWADSDAAQKAIPIRVDTNLRMYRRIH